MSNASLFRPMFATRREHPNGGTFAQPSGRVGSFLFWGLVAYLATVVFEGPLRYVLSSVGLGGLIYLRDVMMVLAIALGLFSAAVQRKELTGPLVVVTYLLLVYLFLGLLIGDSSFFSALFGLKIFAVFLFGMAAATAIEERSGTFQRLVGICLLVSLAGVAINFSLGKYPWEGMVFETTFGVTSTTREWWSAGERRLPGFARASFDAAMIIGICFAILLSRLNRVQAMVIGAVCMAGVYLTTSKGMMMALGIATLWWSLVPGSYRKRTGGLIAVGLLCLVLILPIAACSLELGQRFVAELPRGLSSFADRIVYMWPLSCSILKTPYSWVLGAGIGSIGVPQQYGWLSRTYSSADNLFVYLFVNGGILWAIGLVATVFVALRRGRLSSLLDESGVRALLIIMLGYGITTNMQEQPFFAAIAGILVAHVWGGSARMACSR